MDPVDQFSLVRPSFSNQPGLQRNIRPEDIELDLSNETFLRLEAKIADVYNQKDDREKQTAGIAEVLRNLWDVLNIPEDDLERGITVRSLEGPTRSKINPLICSTLALGFIYNRLKCAKVKCDVWNVPKQNNCGNLSI